MIFFLANVEIISVLFFFSSSLFFATKLERRRLRAEALLKSRGRIQIPETKNRSTDKSWILLRRERLEKKRFDFLITDATTLG